MEWENDGTDESFEGRARGMTAHVFVVKVILSARALQAFISA